MKKLVALILGIWGSLLTLFGILSREDIRWLRGLLGKRRPTEASVGQRI